MRRNPISLAAILGVILLVASACAAGGSGLGSVQQDLQSGDYASALASIDLALQEDPNNAEAHYLRGQVLQTQAEDTTYFSQHVRFLQEAMAAYDRALVLDPELQDEIAAIRSIAYNNAIQAGADAFNLGDAGYADAAVYFEGATILEPDSTTAFTNWGFALMQAGQGTAAIQPFETVVNAGGPVESDVYVFLADLYLSNDRANDAIQLLQRARTDYPQNEDIQTQLLNAYIVTGQEEEAIQEYAGAVERNPNNETFRYNYGSLLLNEERYDDAIVQLEAAVRINPDYADAQYNLGAAWVNKAVDANSSYNDLDDALRAERANLTPAQIQQRQAAIDEMAEQRTEFFSSAIEPLERARELQAASGTDIGPVCQALFQAYVQTRQTDKAEAVQECAGFDD